MADTALVHPSIPLIYVFNTMCILSVLCLLAIITIAWRSPAVYRSATWYSFLTTWILYDLVHMLLLGRQTGDQPGYSLCLIQASLHYMAPALAAFAGVAMVIELFLSVWISMPLGKNASTRTSTGVYLLLIIPPGLSLFVFVEALVYGIQHPDKVARANSGMVCLISDPLPMIASAGFVIASMLCIMLIEICIAVNVCRHWKAFRKLAKYERDSRNWENCTTIIRFTFFFALAMLTFGIGIGISFGNASDWDSLLNARCSIVNELMPVGVALIFGTQKDILQSLMFCRRWKRSQDIESHVAREKDTFQSEVTVPTV